MKTLGKRLKFARESAGITQKDLESKSGVSQQLISKIENEKIESTTEVFTLADALKVNAKWLSTGVGELKRNARDTDTAQNAKDGLTDEAMEFAQAFQELPSEQRAVLQSTAKAFMDTTKKQKGNLG